MRPVFILILATRFKIAPSREINLKTYLSNAQEWDSTRHFCMIARKHKHGQLQKILCSYQELDITWSTRERPTSVVPVSAGTTDIPLKLKAIWFCDFVQIILEHGHCTVTIWCIILKEWLFSSISQMKKTIDPIPLYQAEMQELKLKEVLGNNKTFLLSVAPIIMGYDFSLWDRSHWDAFTRFYTDKTANGTQGLHELL